MRTHFLKMKRFFRCPFLQNGKNNHFLKTQALKNQELQVRVTIIPMISSHCRNAIAFLQNDQIFNMQRSQDLKSTTNNFQVLVTIFLKTSSHSRNAIAFLQNDQLYNNHRTLDHQGRGNLSLHLKKPRRSPTMSPMSRWKALKSTSRTSERGLTRC